MLTAKEAAPLTAEQSAAVDAYMNSPEVLAWQRRTTARWGNSPGYAQHLAQARSKRIARRNAESARRHAAKLQRTPPWADKDAIQAVYEQARALTESTGAPHHVDHFYPLQGRLVSGLHVAANLQILPGLENMRKNNRYEPEA